MRFDALVVALMLIIFEWAALAYLVAGFTSSSSAFMLRLYRFDPFFGKRTESALRRMFRITGIAIGFSDAILVFFFSVAHEVSAWWQAGNVVIAAIALWYAAEVVLPGKGGPLLRFLLRRVDEPPFLVLFVARLILGITAWGLLSFAFGAVTSAGNPV